MWVFLKEKIGAPSAVFVIAFLGVCLPAFAGLDLGPTGNVNGDQYSCDDWEKATVEDVRKWIAESGQVNAKDSNFGMTSLGVAAHCSEDTTIIDMLVEAGVDVNAADIYGQTPIYLAGSYSKFDNVIALLAHGADLNIRRTDTGKTVLEAVEWSVKSSNVTYPKKVEMLKLLSDPARMRREAEEYLRRYRERQAAATGDDNETAVEEDSYGSIYLSIEKDGGYAAGIAWHHWDIGSARKGAWAECKGAGGTKCEEVHWFQNGCGALAVAGGTESIGFGTNGAKTLESAKQNAMNECNSLSANQGRCEIVFAECAQ